jgi:hypothetical protein
MVAHPQRLAPAQPPTPPAPPRPQIVVARPGPGITSEPTAAVLALRLAPVARATLLDALYKEIGEEGSLLDHPNGKSFTLKRDQFEGVLHSNHPLMVLMPNGGSVAHVADLVIDVEAGALVYVDVYDGQSTMKEVKAGAFDAFHLKARPRKHHAVCVFVRSPHSVLQQEQVEAVGHSYDYCFGVDDSNATLGLKFAACLAEIQRRIVNGN